MHTKGGSRGAGRQLWPVGGALLLALGYAQPTPIQAKTIRYVFAGDDRMVTAQTGPGKTAPVTLPMLQRLLPHFDSSALHSRGNAAATEQHAHE